MRTPWVCILCTLASFCVPCRTFQGAHVCGFSSAVHKLSHPMQRCQLRTARNTWSLVAVPVRRGNLICRQQLWDGAETVSQVKAERGNVARDDAFSVHGVDASDVEEFCQLIVDVFQPAKGPLVNTLSRKVWRLNLYIGVVSRIFIASYAKGVREGSSTSYLQAKASPDELHALFGVSDAQNQLSGVIELNCMPCPIPLSRGAQAEPQMPFISNLAVREDCRGQGLATAMVQRCEEEARAWGSDEIFLATDTANNKALTLYHKLGYVAEMVDPLASIPKVYLRKTLGPAAAPHPPDALKVTPWPQETPSPKEGEGPAVKREIVISDDPVYQPPPHPLLKYVGPLAPVIISSWAVIAFILF